MEFYIKTADNVYAYQSTIPVGITFTPDVNIKAANTQGFLRKVQKGKYRLNVRVVMKVSAADYWDILVPMLEYSDDVIVQFDRNIPGRDLDIGTFTFEDMAITQEFDCGDEMEVSLSLVEVLTV